MDKKGKLKNSTERGNTDDESAYELIMKDKERLLSYDTPLRFIFSHSALREGWDNPNVFQICTLVETVDPFTKRQKIGR
jgi:type III restriction enzyme